MYDMKNMAKLKNLQNLAPETVNSFLVFTETALKDGAIPAKYKELIAVAVAVTTQCPYCIEDHAQRARIAGASDAELGEATMVAAALRAGGSVAHGLHVV
ncbi:MAG: carboxymuconolactone decarboxylase family protein [Firmicutes bacterium]|uniref:carboxymuconolactone decarboxylase family protein n=1 Tax=uncultured Idiomarina sp. TaxID=352961 RepID=UPI002423C08E|nr:carboxymuconolactone decarboxylase family protein [uncultured Idiomarina sp.]MCL5050771.1 carboxymuconolactone decarboxylase family protein [Bacillota bacterium]